MGGACFFGVPFLYPLKADMLSVTHDVGLSARRGLRESRNAEAHRNAIQRTNLAAYRSYRRVNTPIKNPNPTAIAMAVSGFRVIAASASCAASVALTCARPICLLAMRPTLEARL